MAAKATMRKIRPTLADILSARKFLAEHFAPTRLVEAASVSRVAGRRVFLKLEMELPTGSFKVRGALWALSEKLRTQAIREVTASSTGNHGAAVRSDERRVGKECR